MSQASQPTNAVVASDQARSYDALVLHDDDSVATAVTALESDDVARVAWPDGQVRERQVVETVPFGHKFALTEVGKGQPILKYGEPIGLARETIQAGVHVHTHNVDSQRGRGDLA